MGNTTLLNFETTESLIEKLPEILGSLKANRRVYMDIFSDGDSCEWTYNPSDFLNMSNISDELREFLPWPNPKQGHSTVLVEGNRIKLTLS